MNKNFLRNKKIIIMGGGTSGWISALYFLNLNKKLNLNLEIKLISSNEIGPIGVGEGTTPIFSSFISNFCNISTNEFLKETKGSIKYGIKFCNWNFDDQYYYHLFTIKDEFEKGDIDIDFGLLQYLINNDINIPQKFIQQKIFGNIFDIIEDNGMINTKNYAYHFSASLIIPFLMKKCLEFDKFLHIDGGIQKINYDETGYIKNLHVQGTRIIEGDFFINCLGFNSKNILNEEYFNIKGWEKYILNNSAFAIQVKNSEDENIEPYTTSTAQEYGWTWKIPQFEKTGYGYVYSDNFINDEEKIYTNLLKTYNIKETNVFKTKIIKSSPYYNEKQLHKNCLSLGLSSGFVEPLEATSIHMTIFSLLMFSELIDDNAELDKKTIEFYNLLLKNNWKNVFKFIIYHYFTKTPINDYWIHYKNIQNNEIFEFFEKYRDDSIFSKRNYFQVSLGLNHKNFFYSPIESKFLRKNVDNFLKLNYTLNKKNIDPYFHKTFLKDINR
jgi:tryptophan 7-halogenase